MFDLLLLVPLLLGGLLSPQTPEEDQAALDAARARLEEVKADASAEGQAWQAACQARVKLLEELLATEKGQASLPDEASLDQRAAELDSELEAARNPEEPSITMSSPEELTPYEQAATAAAAALVSKTSDLEAITNKHHDAEIELTGLADRGQRASDRIENLAGESDLDRYRVENARIESRVVSMRAPFLTSGLTLWKKQEKNLEKEVELAALNVEQAKKLTQLAEAEATRLRELEAQRTREEAEAASRQAELEKDPIARFRLNAKAEAGQLRARSKQFEATLIALNSRLVTERATRRDLDAERETLDDRLRLRPRGAEGILKQHLERSRRAKQIIKDVELPQLYIDLEANQDLLAEVLDRLWNARLPSVENEKLSALKAELDESRHAEAEEIFSISFTEDGLEEALRESSDQYEQAAGLYADLLKELDQRAVALDAYQEFIRSRMLWTQSDPPLDGRAMKKALAELRSIPQPYREDQTWQRFKNNLSSGLPILLLVALAIAALRLIARRFANWRESGTSLTPALRHLVRVSQAIVWAACPSLQLYALAWSLFAIGGPEAFDPPFTTLMIYQGHFVFARRLTRVTFAKGGLLVGPHAFPQDIGMQLARAMRTLTLSGQMFFAPYLVFAGSPFQFQIVPRVFFTLWMFGASLAALGLLRRNGALIQTWTMEGGVLRSILRFLTNFTTLALVPILGLDVLGYRVGAQTTLLNSLKIFGGLFVLAVLFRLMERLGQYWVDRATQADSEEDSRLIEARGVGIRAIVRVLTYVIIGALAYYLKESMGIGGVLSKLLAEWQIAEVQPDVWLTGWDCVLASLWVFVGHILSSNLRRLHESLVAPFADSKDEGGSYAFLAILRYLLLGVTYTGALLTLGFSFETLGWFATAASVGLGFGLQEIVANFVSGIILLLERPIRVGDIVTIGLTSGKIEAISIRATTITNWERQTIIVPNKKFVTEDLTNWTRADTVMRRFLIIRVAYGSDVEKVLRLIDEVISSHPDVLPEPKHKVLFDNFGVVGIEFRATFYAQISSGKKARSEIFAEINKRFDEEGIVIPTVKRPEEIPGQAPPPA